MTPYILPEQENVARVITRVFDAYLSSMGKIRPHFLLAGPSGSGKSHLVKVLAEQQQMGFLAISAAALTKEGVSGNSLSKELSGLKRVNSASGIVVFVDEFDKLFTNGESGSTHESLSGVQNEFLTVLESDTASVFGDYGKYDTIDVSRILFVFAGAFNGETNLDYDKLRAMGMRTEFLGRVSLCFQTEAISKESLIAMLKQSQLLKEYLNVFPTAKRDKVVKSITTQIEMAYRKNAIGVRMVSQLIHQYFLQGDF